MGNETAAMLASAKVVNGPSCSCSARSQHKVDVMVSREAHWLRLVRDRGSRPAQLGGLGRPRRKIGGIKGKIDRILLPTRS